MAESKQHIILIERIVKYLSDEYSEANLFILSDLPEESQDNRPTQIIKYTPDVYASNPISGFTVIGEAKTIKDIENQHSVNQVQEFVEFLNVQGEESLMILSVPPEGAVPAQRLLNAFRKGQPSSTKLLILNGISVLNVEN